MGISLGYGMGLGLGLGIQVGNAAWSPASLTGIASYVVPGTNETLSGGKLAALGEVVGGGSWTQATPASYGATPTTINGVAAYTNGWVKRGVTLGGSATSAHVFLICEGTGTWSRSPIGLSSGNSAAAGYYPFSDNNIYTDLLLDASKGRPGFPQGADNKSRKFLLEAYTSGGTWKMDINGTNIQTITGNATINWANGSGQLFPMLGIDSGNLASGPTLFAVCKWGEMALCVGNIITGAELTQARNYFAAKYGVTIPS